MGKLSRDKGKAFERLTARILREVFHDSKRMRQSPTFTGAVDTPDVEAGPFDIECRNQKNVSRPKAVRDAQRYARSGRMWAAVVKEHGSKLVELTMDIEVFVRLCKKLHETPPEQELDTAWIEDFFAEPAEGEELTQSGATLHAATHR